MLWYNDFNLVPFGSTIVNTRSVLSEITETTAYVVSLRFSRKHDVPETSMRPENSIFSALTTYDVKVAIFKQRSNIVFIMAFIFVI